jgi:exopolysaccharide production protein ExoQ
LARQIPKGAFAIGYLALGLVVVGDALFAQEYLQLTYYWLAWYVAVAVALVGSAYYFFKSDWQRVFRQIPIELTLLIALMLGSVLWSYYPTQTISSFLIQIGVTLSALFMVAVFSWRQILGIFANTIRAVIFGALSYELFLFVLSAMAKASILGVSEELFQTIRNIGQVPDGRTIDDLLLRNSFMGAWALMGLITFLVQLAITKRHRVLTVISIVLSLVTITLSGSAGIVFASVAVGLAGLVSLLAEGKDKETRHRYYRVAWAISGLAGFLVLIFRRGVFEFLGKSPDMTHRTDIWLSVFNLGLERPLEGLGFTGVWVPGVEPYAGLIVINGIEYFQAHNSYLEMWLQLGTVGLVLFLILLTRTFIKTWRLGVHHSNVLYLWPLLLFVIQLVRGITESRMLIQSAMFMLILFAVKSHDPEELLEENSRKPKRKQLEQISKRPITRLIRR